MIQNCLKATSNVALAAFISGAIFQASLQLHVLKRSFISIITILGKPRM